jgi:hypothetical protein
VASTPIVCSTPNRFFRIPNPPFTQVGFARRPITPFGSEMPGRSHFMHYRRQELRNQKVLPVQELRTRMDGELVRTAGCIIAGNVRVWQRDSSFFQWKMKQALPTSLSHLIFMSVNECRDP